MFGLVYQSLKDLLMAERWRDMLLCPVYTRSLALIQEREEMGYMRYRTVLVSNPSNRFVETSVREYSRKKYGC